MRIIAGKNRGTKLFAPKGDQTRPTSDRVKEYIFSCMNFDFSGQTVLDIFAGSGALGLEAASRGAENITLVDNSFLAIEAIKKNAEKLRLSPNIQKRDVLAFLKGSQNSFDCIFCDPPYKFSQTKVEQIFDILFEKKILKKGGFFIYESSSADTDVNHDGFTVVKNKILGDTKVSIYEKTK